VQPPPGLPSRGARELTSPRFFAPGGSTGAAELTASNCRTAISRWSSPVLASRPFQNVRFFRQRFVRKDSQWPHRLFVIYSLQMIWLDITTLAITSATNTQLGRNGFLSLIAQ